MNSLVIKSTPKFDELASKLMKDATLDELLTFLEQNPEHGRIISGTGGVRKLRWKNDKNNKGKSGGVRVLYHYSNEVLIILVTLFEKSEKENISVAEKAKLKKLMPKLIEYYRGDL